MKKRKLKYLLISSSLLLTTGVSFLYVNNLKSEETKANSNSISSNSDSENSESEFEYINKIFNKEEVLSINIEISEDDLNDLLENAIDEKYHKATIYINGEKFTDVGIRTKGNSSLSMVASDDTTDRYSFKIKTDKYVDGQNIYGLTEFVLNNNIGDATSMKEYLSYDILNSIGVKTPGYSYTNISINNENWGLYLTVESIEEEFIERNFGNTDGNLYKVESMSMNNLPQGDKKPNGKEMQEAMEPPNNKEMPNDFDPSDNFEKPENIDIPSQTETTDKIDTTNEPKEFNSFNKNENGGMPENFTMPENSEIPKGNKGMEESSGASLVYTDDEISSYSDIFDNTIFKDTTEDDYNTLINIIKNLNEGTDLEKYIDVDEVLRYFAVNTFIVNLDSYVGTIQHNYYLYEDSSKLSILPWDYNLSFGAFNINNAEKAVNFPIDNPVTNSLENTPLLSKLLEVSEYKEKYHEYLKEIAENYFLNDAFKNIVSKLDSLIENYIENDPTAFYTYDEYKDGLSNLIQFGIDRTTSVLAQLDGTQSSTEYGTIKTSVNLEAMGTQNPSKINKFN